MRNAIFILCFFCFQTAFRSFRERPGDYAPTIEKQADLMGRSLVKKDYKTFVKYADPRVVQAMGGESAFIDTLKHFDAQRSHYGASIVEINVDDATWVIDTAAELQTTILVTTKTKVKGGVVTTTALFIGTSKDKGKNWVFMDTSQDFKIIRKKYPDISSKLVIFGPPKPTFKED